MGAHVLVGLLDMGERKLEDNSFLDGNVLEPKNLRLRHGALLPPG
jgi:hypothetical protein